MNADDPGTRLFEELVQMFRPHVEAVQMPKMLAWARSPYGEEEREVLLRFWLTPMALMAFMEWRREKSLLRGILKMIGEVYKAVFKRPRMSEKEIAVAIEQWMPELTAMFVRGWINTLLRPTTDMDALDDAMLPAGSVPLGIMMAGGDGDYSEGEVRGILRAVKATLPPGRSLPDEAREIIRITQEREAALFDPRDPLAIVDSGD